MMSSVLAHMLADMHILFLLAGMWESVLLGNILLL